MRVINKVKLISGTMAVVMAAAGTGAAPVTYSEEYRDVDIENSKTDTEAVSDNENEKIADKKDNGKEEVIYIMIAADGGVENVNAVNIFNSGNVIDYGDYSSVKMLNTTDNIYLDGDKVTFSSNKDRVYYQGTLEDTQIPWKIRITYTLDGEEIDPDQLAGSTGALKIRIKISKNAAYKGDFYDNYALQASVTLDTDKCSNITADDATLANVGADKQISYTVLPGKGLDAVITADVKDFEMDAVAINGVKMGLDIDIDDEELMEKVTDLMSAAKYLNDGAGELADGSSELKDGGGSLADGAKSLNDGANSLDDGINTLSNGVNTMQTALITLNSKSGELTEGSAQVMAALKKIQGGLSGVSMSADDLNKLVNSSASIKQGIDDVYNGAVSLQNSISYSGYKAVMSSNGLDIDGLQSQNSSAINTLSSQINELSSMISQIESMPDYGSNDAYTQQINELQSQINSLNNTIALLQGNNAAISGTRQYMDGLQQGATDLVNGVAALKSSYEQFDAAIVSMCGKLSELTVNVGQLKTGVDELVKSYSDLDSGINDYTDGVAQIVASYQQIVTGTGKLASGSSQIVQGSAAIKQGTLDMYSGLESLNEGAGTLSDGTNELYEETDGMDIKIQDTIDEMLGALSGGDTEAVSFVSDKNKNVDSVQFVIKTSAIEKPEETVDTEVEEDDRSLWQKFKDLF